MLNFRENIIFLKPFFSKLKLVVSGRVFKWCLYPRKVSFFFIHFNKKRFFFNKNFLFDFFKIGKFSIFLQTYELFNKKKLLANVNLVKKYSVFTKRGVFFKNSVFFKKKGKVSSYITQCLIFFIFFVKTQKIVFLTTTLNMFFLKKVVFFFY
jgi:hypothetical protein